MRNFYYLILEYGISILGFIFFPRTTLWVLFCRYFLEVTTPGWIVVSTIVGVIIFAIDGAIIASISEAK